MESVCYCQQPRLPTWTLYDVCFIILLNKLCLKTMISVLTCLKINSTTTSLIDCWHQRFIKTFPQITTKHGDTIWNRILCIMGYHGSSFKYILQTTERESVKKKSRNPCQRLWCSLCSCIYNILLGIKPIRQTVFQWFLLSFGHVLFISSRVLMMKKGKLFKLRYYNRMGGTKQAIR